MRLLLVMMLTIFITKANTVNELASTLERMEPEQYVYMVLAYKKGKLNNMGLLLTAIIWKESSFGKRLINPKDGMRGSFGIAQILLDTAIKRNKVKTKKGIKNLKLKLLTDHAFNLDQAIAELTYWKWYHREYVGRKDWRLYTVASYNAGRKSYDNFYGRKYAMDIAIRIEALKKFFKRNEFNFNMHVDNDLLSISKDLRK